MSASRARVWGVRVARLVLALLPAIWLARKIDLHAVARDVQRVGWLRLGLGFAALFAAVVIGSWRWRLLLVGYAGRSPPTRTLMRHQLVGLYYNVLPSGLAGDAVRAYRVRGWVGSMTGALAVALVERLSGLLGLLLLAAPTALVGRSGGSVIGRPMAAGALVAVAFGLVLLSLPKQLAKSERARGWVAKIPVAGALILKLPPPPNARVLFGAVLLSCGTQLGAGAAMYALMLPLGADPARALEVIPPAILLTFIPITPGGFGQRELVFAWLFAGAGLGREASVTVGVLTLALTLALAALGAAVHAWERVRGLEGAEEPERDIAPR